MYAMLITIAVIIVIVIAVASFIAGAFRPWELLTKPLLEGLGNIGEAVKDPVLALTFQYPEDKIPTTKEFIEQAGSENIDLTLHDIAVYDSSRDILTAKDPVQRAVASAKGLSVLGTEFVGSYIPWIPQLSETKLEEESPIYELPKWQDPLIYPRRTPRR